MASDLQTFIARIKADGLLPSNRFEVKIPGFFGAQSKEMSLMCDAIQWPGKTLSSSPITTFGEVREFPTGTIEYDQISMSFLCDRNLSVLEEFNKWHMQVYNTKSRKSNYYSSYVRDIEILIMDKKETSSNANSSRKITLKECWPKVIGSFDLNYAMENPLYLKVTFAYKWFEDSLTGSQSTEVKHPPRQTARYANQSSPANSKPSTAFGGGFGGGFGGLGGQENNSLFDFSGGATPTRSFLDTLGSSELHAKEIASSAEITKNAIRSGDLPDGDRDVAYYLSESFDDLHTGISRIKTSIDNAVAKADLGIPNLPTDIELMFIEGPTGISAGAQSINWAIESSRDLIRNSIHNGLIDNTTNSYKDGSGAMRPLQSLENDLENTYDKLDTVYSMFDEFMVWTEHQNDPQDPGAGSFYSYELDPNARGTPEFQRCVQDSLNIIMGALGDMWEVMLATKVMTKNTYSDKACTPQVIERSKSGFLSLANNTPSISNQISKFF